MIHTSSLVEMMILRTVARISKIKSKATWILENEMVNVKVSFF